MKGGISVLDSAVQFDGLPVVTSAGRNVRATYTTFQIVYI